MSKSLLTFEELYTVLVQAEAILNSRPLIKLTEDHQDFHYLSVGHFLIGRPLVSIPFTNEFSHSNLKGRWLHVLSMNKALWDFWKANYLQSLQQRSKWLKETENIKPNSVVILKEDNTSPSNWKLGIIDKVHPGSDGLVRVVTVRTATGVYKRLIVKLCPLPNVDLSNTSEDKDSGAN